MVNLGILNDKFILGLSNVLVNESHRSNDLVKLFGDYNNTIKSNNSLLMEFMVYENLTSVSGIKENGMEYLNTVLSGLNNLSLKELNEGRSKLLKFIELFDGSAVVKNQSLHESIEYLINDKFSTNPIKDTKKLWESKNNIITHISRDSNNTTISDTVSNDLGSNFKLSTILKHSNELFNNKISSLNEEDKSVLKSFVEKDIVKLEEAFNKVKKETISFLNEKKNDDSNYDSTLINEVINKINTMSYNTETFIEDVATMKELSEL